MNTRRSAAAADAVKATPQTTKAKRDFMKFTGNYLLMRAFIIKEG